MDQSQTIRCVIGFRADRLLAKQFAGVITVTNIRNGRTVEAYWARSLGELPLGVGFIAKLLDIGPCDLTIAQLRSFKRFASEHQRK